MVTIASQQNYELQFDSENRIILMRFRGDFTDEQYKSFWTQAIDMGVSQRINRVIIDQREIGNVSFNARGWVVINAFPRVKKEMPKNLAAGVLSSGRVVQKTGMQYLMKAFVALTGYKVELFPSTEECVSFLKKANKPEQVFARA
ncbi:hypothetical protein [Nafulsella turpanensis]|uniref:hypothetical protein n=1 Tax=Nafulsella turpanensis TaxID=1265690 RepID=UPI00058AC1B7|nr:hypothetical protein [Nafulsella turpanensis]